MPKKMSVTALRKNLYRVVDEILETGEAVEVERNGKTLLITPAPPEVGRLSRLPRRDEIVGDPEDLVSLRVASWGDGEVEP
ncbi:MAG: hypothetical protein U5K81_08560 [Trueperaceae bacterium]|nr:hypothetical protein [Trueperaceae bacterium]